MADIDVGSEAIDRDTFVGKTTTTIDAANPANLSGKVTSIEIWSLSNLITVTVGTFYTTNGNTLKCRAAQGIGNIIAGAKRTVSGLDIAIEAGDFIGAHWADGNLELDVEGGVGVWGKSANYVYANSEETYTWYEYFAMSLKGLGATEVVTHELVVTDGIALTDTVIKTTMKEVSDGVALSDALIKNPIKTLVDGIALADVWEGYKLLAKVFIDGIALADALVKSTAKVVSDGIAFTDVVYRVFTKVLSDGVAIGDALRKDIAKTFTDGIAFTDIVHRTFEKVFTDGIKIADCLIRWRFLAAIRNLTRRRCPQASIREQEKIDDGLS